MEIGKVSGNVLKRSVLGQIKFKREEVVSGAGMGADCAIFSYDGSGYMAACMQEAQVCWPLPQSASIEAAVQEGVRDTGVEPYMTLAQLIQKCANNLAAAGSSPAALMLTLFLPERAEESHLKALLKEAEQMCAELSMELMGGQTRMIEKITCPIAVAAIYGKTGQGTEQMLKSAAPGQDIVISKWIGLQGTALAVKRNRAKLLARYPSYLVEEAELFDRYLSVIPEAAIAVKSGVCAMHDASEGGIFAALWEMAERAGVGLNIDLKKLPLRQETVEVCECCDLNPYELLAGGCMIMTSVDGQALADALLAENIPAVVVGRVTEGNRRILLNGEEIRYLDRPKQDQIYKL